MIFTALAPRLIQSISRNVHNKFWALKQLTYRRLLFHHEILSRDEEETIRKIYFKMKRDNVKGDWIRLLERDFAFIGISMDEEEISTISKYDYNPKK